MAPPVTEMAVAAKVPMTTPIITLYESTRTKPAMKPTVAVDKPINTGPPYHDIAALMISSCNLLEHAPSITTIHREYWEGGSI